MVSPRPSAGAMLGSMRGPCGGYLSRLQLAGQVVAGVSDGGHVGSRCWCVPRAEVSPRFVGESVVNSVPGNVLGVYRSLSDVYQEA